MSFQYKTLQISQLGIIGAGHIGPDIALHFARSLAPAGVQITMVDISQEALQQAREKFERKTDRMVSTGILKAAQAETIKASARYTTDYQALAGAQLVLEAATEDFDIKHRIFAQLEQICGARCIFLSNSSHMHPEMIFDQIKDRSRCLVAHYFFPAERNPIVEVVPGAETDPALTDLLMGFYEAIGKAPIQVRSSYAFAVDPIFEGLVQCAVLCRENGLGNEKEIDAVAVRTLGMGVGHFTAISIANGNPITDHGLDEMHHRLMPWFRSPPSLKEKAQRGIARWDIAERGEQVTVSQEKQERIRDEYLGCLFGLAGFIMDLEIVDIDDLNMAVNIALDMHAPFTLMNQMGMEQAHALVARFCAAHPDFRMPQSLERARAEGGWKLSDVKRSRIGDIAVLKIRRPRVLNALNAGVVDSLKAFLREAEADPAVAAVVITGHGTKAFVSGADIDALANCRTAEQAYRFSRNFQQLTEQIEAMRKPVVCAINGLAFGGGTELALACAARVARAGLSTLARLPEPTLGIIPGGGGTQRLPRLIGVEAAARLIRAATPVSSDEALKLGLVDQLADDPLQAAVALARQLAAGTQKAKALPQGKIDCPARLPEVDIGYFSRCIDALLCQAIVEGAQGTLAQGLEIEARLVGRCMETEDAKIGIDNFKREGARAKAVFVHR
ncbi:MAG: 3-hydroxyacyl-CoA dehydrogenase/enoyl-CoA hydratase family protein [Burkholderiaceae bacterium]|jgi:enoyl-CoA hydratase/3-hydroxyacyl-CoA dehydrogenase|nr:3-hydroxyacyl-CoA dehydrogenase/enoyl-CoA hydratase family protein [Burkholderiaceae bacterium]